MIKKGGTYVCVPCGLRVKVTECGITSSRLMCCGKAMSPKKKVARKKKRAKK